MDTETHNLDATHMQSSIKMHANRFALSLPLPGIHNQPKLLALQNKENRKKKDVPHFRAVVANWLQGCLFIFCGDLKEKDEDLLVKLGTWDCSPSTIRGLSREMKINKHRGAPETTPWNWGASINDLAASAHNNLSIWIRFAWDCQLNLQQQLPV